MDWSSIFDEIRPAPGASEADIECFVATIGLPLSVAELAEVNRSQKNPFPVNDPLHGAYRPFDPSGWLIPSRPLPPDYLSFLRWSNGGWCRTGDREFGFFPTNDATGGVRAMMLAYQVPQYMPGAVPFAFNGGGTFYLFDMREPAKDGNYPVVCAHAGSQGWGPEHWSLANSFEAACRGSTEADDARDELRGSQAEPEIDVREPVAVYLEQPLKSLTTLVAIRQHLGITTSVAELKKLAESAPCCITEGLTYIQAMRRCARVNEIEQCLGIRLLSDRAICLPLSQQTENRR